MPKKFLSTKAGKDNSPKFSSRQKREESLPKKSCCKIKNVTFVLLGVFVSFVAASVVLILFNSKSGSKIVVKKDRNITSQIDNLAKKANPSNFEFPREEIPLLDDETSLPVVDQGELAEQYQNELKKIISNLEQQIQLFREQEILDIQTIQEVKGKVMEEIVPKNYQDLHLDLVLGLDLMIGGDVNQAKEIFSAIKSKIEIE